MSEKMSRREFVKALAAGLAAGGGAGVFPKVGAAAGAVYYASPRGGGDGRSKSSPFQIADFWSAAKPGDTLLLLDGKYSGAASMINPPRGEFREGKLVQKGLCGELGKPITVKALHDGKVEIEGERRRQPVYLYGNDYFVLAGFSAHDSSRAVVELSRSDHNVVRRVCAWEAADENNGECFGTHYAEHNLFEDCAGWGTARKVYHNSQSGNYTTYRRCWGRWEGCHVVGPKMTYSLFYNSHHIVAENCIGTWDARRMKETYVLLDGTGQKPYVSDEGSERYRNPLTFTNYGVDQPYGIFGMDANRVYGWNQMTKGPFVYGCIAYALPQQRCSGFIGLFFINSTEPEDGYVEHCLAYRHPNAQGATLRVFSLGNCGGGNLTAVGKGQEKICAPGLQSIVESPDGRDIVTKRGHLLNTPGGASILYRYENGKLTDQSLWPWPMNQRIIDAMKLAGYDDPVDVTKTIFELAGGKMPRLRGTKHEIGQPFNDCFCGPGARRLGGIALGRESAAQRRASQLGSVRCNRRFQAGVDSPDRGRSDARSRCSRRRPAHLQRAAQGRRRSSHLEATMKEAGVQMAALFGITCMMAVNHSTRCARVAADARPPTGALAVHPRNPHCFITADGKPVLLVGDYTWGTFSDLDYDFDAMFDTLKANGLNFARVWVFWGNETGFESNHPPEHYHRVNVVPYERTGPGEAADSRPKYDLTRFNPAFFRRLRDVSAAARRRRLFLQLTLFDAWMIKHPHLWRLHAYHRDNNINGVDGDPRNTKRGTDGQEGFCSMGNPKALEAQKAFVRKAVETVNGFDNILFEIANENYYNAEWELELCRFIHDREKGKRKQHLAMPLDLPNHDYGGIKTWDLQRLHTNLLKARTLRQPLIFDTDGIGSPEDTVIRRAAWTAFTSGGHVSYLDESLQPGGEHRGDHQGSSRLTMRRQLGHLARFARQVSFWEMEPKPDLVKAGGASALASKDELVAYLPEGGGLQLDLSHAKGAFTARWFNPREGRLGTTLEVAGDSKQELQAPDGNDWTLHLRRDER